nr:reverse transcriptase domain-containing protein [Tanacetum cinerariifolium]
MRTRSSSNLLVESFPNPTTSNPKHHNRRRSKQPFILEESPVDTMADQRTMSELLRAPTEGYAEAIVVPPILAEQFELKHSLINMMTSNQFFELTKDNHHDHIHWFNKITFTIKYKDVPKSAIKLMLFPFSFIGAARRWLEKEPPRSILMWEDLVSKFINEFFPPQEQQIYVMKFQTFNNGLMNRFMRHGIDTKSPSCMPSSSDANCSSSSEIAKLTHAVNQQTSDVTTAMIAILKQFQATPPLASVKSDNIQGYVSAAAINYNQAVIFKKIPKKLGDPRKFLIPYGFSELKCKALADLADFIIIDYESDPRVPLILGRPFLRTAQALIDVHKEEMILRDEGGNVLIEKLLDLDSTKDLLPPHNVNPLSGSTTSSSSSPNHLLEEFVYELALITFPSRNDDLPFDIESDLKMFTDEHALDYSSPPLYDEYDDDLFEVESNTKYVYDDPFDSKGEKIKESKLLIDELDLSRSSDFLPSPEYDSFFLEDFSKVDALPSTNNEDNVFNPGILIRENLFEVITHVAPDKNVKKISISHASLILEDFDPPLYELPFLKEVPCSETLLLFSSEK